ncbi:ABC transporter substrate-binding protein [Sesbania bispinosa]|nr:ABC transporter substrate-binding protein [Sesbania bispinosa]
MTTEQADPLAATYVASWHGDKDIGAENGEDALAITWCEEVPFRFVKWRINSLIRINDERVRRGLSR